MYQPGTLPTKTEDLRKYVYDELRRIADALQPLLVESVAFKVEQVGVDKPRSGAVAYSAAGVLGANEGLYRYTVAGAWVYVG